MQFTSDFTSSWLLCIYFAAFVCSFPFQDMDIVKRQSDATSTATPAATATNSAQITSGSSDPTLTSHESNPSSGLTSGSAITGGTSKTTSRAQGTAVDPRSPPGSVLIQSPATTSGSLYYKLGQQITFAWNYTNLLIAPTALNVEAFYSGGPTYTIASNASIAQPTAVWDTGADTYQPPPPMQIYTLAIYDAASAYTAAPVAGHLALFNSFKFGVYSPRPYTPYPDFICTTCDPSSSNRLDVVALRMFVISSIIFSLSFMWFTNGIF